MMRWLTKEQIKKAAKASLLKAVQCSRKHWTQMVSVTAKEFLEAADADKVDFDENGCALCGRFGRRLGGTDAGRCGSCPFNDGSCRCCCEEYKLAGDILDELCGGKKVNWQTFRKYGNAIIARLAYIEARIKAGLDPCINGDIL